MKNNNKTTLPSLPVLAPFFSFPEAEDKSDLVLFLCPLLLFFFEVDLIVLSPIPLRKTALVRTACGLVSAKSPLIKTSEQSPGTFDTVTDSSWSLSSFGFQDTL